jgi:hypothetical protein
MVTDNLTSILTINTIVLIHTSSILDFIGLLLKTSALLKSTPKIVIFRILKLCTHDYNLLLFTIRLRLFATVNIPHFHFELT